MLKINLILLECSFCVQKKRKKMRGLEKSVQLGQDLHMFYSERCLVEVLETVHHIQETVKRLTVKVMRCGKEWTELEETRLG